MPVEGEDCASKGEKPSAATKVVFKHCKNDPILRSYVRFFHLFPYTSFFITSCNRLYIKVQTITVVEGTETFDNLGYIHGIGITIRLMAQWWVILLIHMKQNSNVFF